MEGSVRFISVRPSSPLWGVGGAAVNTITTAFALLSKGEKKKKKLVSHQIDSN